MRLHMYGVCMAHGWRTMQRVCGGELTNCKSVTDGGGDLHPEKRIGIEVIETGEGCEYKI